MREHIVAHCANLSVRRPNPLDDRYRWTITDQMLGDRNIERLMISPVDYSGGQIPPTGRISSAVNSDFIAFAMPDKGVSLLRYEFGDFPRGNVYFYMDTMFTFPKEAKVDMGYGVTFSIVPSEYVKVLTNWVVNAVSTNDKAATVAAFVGLYLAAEVKHFDMNIAFSIHWDGSGIESSLSIFSRFEMRTMLLDELRSPINPPEEEQGSSDLESSFVVLGPKVEG